MWLKPTFFPIWQFALIFFACLAVFLPVMVLRQMPFGFDSYYYLNIVCNGAAPIEAEPFFSKAWFQAMPCNVPFLLAINFILLLSCCLLGSLLGRHFVKENGWLAGFFILGSLVFSMAFFGIESEVFAYFLCLLAAWLFWSE